MKKSIVSIAASVALGTFAMAGGDIAPVEPAVDTPVVETASDSGFYVGVGYSRMSGDIRKEIVENGNVLKLENDYDTFHVASGIQDQQLRRGRRTLLEYDRRRRYDGAIERQSRSLGGRGRVRHG